MHSKYIVFGTMLAACSPAVLAINNAPADASTITLRTSCYENGNAVEISNCFDSVNAMDNWLRNVRQTGPSRPTLVTIGPGTFSGWNCQSSNVTLQGAGRDQTIFSSSIAPSMGNGMNIQNGCTNLDVMNLTIVGEPQTSVSGVLVNNASAITSWANVEIRGGAYGWQETQWASCPSGTIGRNTFSGSRIVSTGGSALFPYSRAYIAGCMQSWFFGSEITSLVTNNETNAFALEAHSAEVHFYGSNARLSMDSNTIAYSGSHYLIRALSGSEVHIHGTGLDLIHKGTGVADMLYADSTSHFHANESGFNIHIPATGTGKVRRLAGDGRIESPYIWGADTQPPLSRAGSGVQTLTSRNGADSYTETDCPLTGNCSAGGDYPHPMIYRAACTGAGANEGPWFDTVTRSCRQ